MEGPARICPKIRGVALVVLSEIEAVVSVYQLVVAVARAIVAVLEAAVFEGRAVALAAARCHSSLASSVGSVAPAEVLRSWISGQNRLREQLIRTLSSKRLF